MTDLQRDIESNRANLRHSHARLMAKAEALRQCAEVAQAKTCSPTWEASIHLEVAIEDGERLQTEATMLLERAATVLEEMEEKS